MKEFTKNNKSLLNALSGLALVFANGFFNIVVIGLVISRYGSDFNGLNSTANQIITLLLIIEGGFSLAVNVALFRPLSINDYLAANRILSAAKRAYRKIGISFLLIGWVASIGYSFILRSNLQLHIIISTFFMVVFSTAFDLLYATKYRVVLQAQQKEYILNIVKLMTITCSQVTVIIMILNRSHMITLRVIIMIGSLTNSLIIAFVCRRKHEFINFNVTPDERAIKGTKDLMIQQITGLLYGAIPILFISVTSGTLLASVYAVYNNIFLLLKQTSHAFISAPRMGLGKLIVEREKAYILKVFLQYELLVINLALCFLSTAVVLITPFIRIYTRTVTDINYENWYIALFLASITFFEIIHIPSGTLINISGNFKVSRIIQLRAFLILIVAITVGGTAFGFYGILTAVLTTAIFLAIAEISFVHMKYFDNQIMGFLRIVLPSSLAITPLSILEYSILPDIDNYLSFLITLPLLLLVNVFILITINYVCNRELLKSVIARIRASLVLFERGH